jgi:hypothetical protein
MMTMTPWNTALQRGLVGGATASLLSAAALAACGRHDSASARAPINAVSHWFWKDEAYRHAEPSWRYTALGYLIHHACATFWSVLFERACGDVLDRKDPVATLGTAGAAAAASCFVDYHLTPQRLQPGYEQHLSRPSLALVYGGLGLGLAVGAMLCRRR